MSEFEIQMAFSPWREDISAGPRPEDWAKSWADEIAGARGRERGAEDRQFLANLYAAGGLSQAEGIAAMKAAVPAVPPERSVKHLGTLFGPPGGGKTMIAGKIMARVVQQMPRGSGLGAAWVRCKDGVSLAMAQRRDADCAEGRTLEQRIYDAYFMVLDDFGNWDPSKENHAAMVEGWVMMRFNRGLPTLLTCNGDRVNGRARFAFDLQDERLKDRCLGNNAIWLHYPGGARQTLT